MAGFLESREEIKKCRKRGMPFFLYRNNKEYKPEEVQRIVNVYAWTKITLGALVTVILVVACTTAAILGYPDIALLSLAFSTLTAWFTVREKRLKKRNYHSYTLGKLNELNKYVYWYFSYVLLTGLVVLLARLI